MPRERLLTSRKAGLRSSQHRSMRRLLRTLPRLSFDSKRLTSKNIFRLIKKYQLNKKKQRLLSRKTIHQRDLNKNSFIREDDKWSHISPEAAFSSGHRHGLHGEPLHPDDDHPAFIRGHEAGSYDLGLNHGYRGISPEPHHKINKRYMDGHIRGKAQRAKDARYSESHLEESHESFIKEQHPPVSFPIKNHEDLGYHDGYNGTDGNFHDREPDREHAKNRSYMKGFRQGSFQFGYDHSDKRLPPHFRTNKHIMKGRKECHLDCYGHTRNDPH